MEIIYKNDKVKKQCTSLRQAKKDFSDKVAKKLLGKINFITSAENLASIINYQPFNFHALRGNLEGYYAMDIDGRRSQYRLIACFDEYSKEQVFTESQIITIIEITEVSKHYE
ncbi:hypothetical protein [Lactobacillus sp. ESL0677]|uniref:hypothetical protein n=1 Tax=Lactobacillus sp. ESL0677 TaxID=2983208 RepID=UPI0023F71E7C|nr:hypothetical protein [Lactobacillus sp. ESL0677]WEV37751.1 hypothetical protein OZX76_04140 [Lactobacillus sp. ESL0677]